MKRDIQPCLWFDSQAEEAADFYVSVFPISEKLGITHYTESTHMPIDTVLTVSFRIRDQTFIALNGGPMFTFSEAISFTVPCEDQAEIDHFWGKLAEGGELQQCGWLLKLDITQLLAAYTG